MINQHSAAADVLVPTLIGAAFDKENLVLTVRFHDEIIAVLMDRLKRMRPFRKDSPGLHFEEPALQGRIIRRSVAIVVHVPGVHKVDRAPFRLGIPVFRPVEIVKVGNTESMSVFVAESAYSGLFLSLQFRCAGIIVNQHIVQLKCNSGAVFEIPLMRPYTVVITFALIPGIEDKHIVHLPVTVIVVLGKVNLVIHKAARLGNQFFRMLVAITALFPIICVIAANGDNIGNVKMKIVGSVPLLIEIRKRTRGPAAIDQSLEIRLVVGESLIFEGSKDDKSIARGRLCRLGLFPEGKFFLPCFLAEFIHMRPLRAAHAWKALAFQRNDKKECRQCGENQVFLHYAGRSILNQDTNISKKPAADKPAADFFDVY